MSKRKFWSPYTAGILLGLTLLATFIVAGRGLGASGAFSLLTGVGLNAMAPGYTGGLHYFRQYLDDSSPLLNWNLFLVLGIFLGGLAGALFTRNARVTFDRGRGMGIGARLITCLVGGMLIGFAARLARGCTSGVALTGGAQLALSGWVFVVAMFAAGFLTAAIFRRLWS